MPWRARRGTAASWTSSNPTLAAGEPGYETDTGNRKWGNGSTAWNALEYAVRRLNDLLDVNTSGASEEEVLTRIGSDHVFRSLTELAPYTTLANRVSTAEAEIAALDPNTGGYIAESRTVRHLTNSTTGQAMITFAAVPEVTLAPGDRLLVSGIFAAYNTSGADANLSPTFKVGTPNMHTADANYPLTIPSVASRTRNLTFDGEVAIGANSSTHVQRSSIWISEPGGSTADSTIGAGNYIPGMAGYPRTAVDSDTAVDIGSTLPLVELRFAWSVAHTGLSLRHLSSALVVLKR